MSKQTFHCIHCGDNFELTDEEQEVYEEGWYDTEPNCCDNCLNNDFAEQDEFMEPNIGL